MRIDPGMIMSTIVALIILSVGVFAFFVTIQNIPVTNTETEEVIQELVDSGNSVFNIIGVVLIIGTIMTIVGLVYSFVAPSGSYNDDEIVIYDDDDDDIPSYSPIYSNLPLEKSKLTKVKSKSKVKKKDSFEWGS